MSRAMNWSAAILLVLIPAKCPFCKNEFPIEQAKKLVRPSPILLVK